MQGRQDRAGMFARGFDETDGRSGLAEVAGRLGIVLASDQFGAGTEFFSGEEMVDLPLGVV